MPSSRLSLRLGQLSHDVLADLAARLCSERPALQAIAEECMAAHKPLSHELVERVLLSPDLVPSILGPLETEDEAAAAVCKQWLAGWKATNEPPWPRRRLKVVPLELPEEIDTSSRDLQMAVTPDGRLVAHRLSMAHILDRSMRVLQTVAGSHDDLIAADDEAIFTCHRGTSVRRSNYGGTIVAEFELEDYQLANGALSPGSLLFSVLWNGNDEQDEIVALDAQTLQLRHRFGLGLLDNAQHLVVVGDELYVCDNNEDRLQVFTLTGEHRRSVTGEWKRPWYLCSAKDRLYLVEEEYMRGDGEEDDDDDPAAPLQGRRILVLSLQGDVLQVVTHPSEPTAVFESICCFDGKLLAGYKYSEAGMPSCNKQAVLALQGL